MRWRHISISWWIWYRDDITTANIGNSEEHCQLSELSRSDQTVLIEYEEKYNMRKNLNSKCKYVIINYMLILVNDIFIIIYWMFNRSNSLNVTDDWSLTMKQIVWLTKCEFGFSWIKMCNLYIVFAFSHLLYFKYERNFHQLLV